MAYDAISTPQTDGAQAPFAATPIPGDLLKTSSTDANGNTTSGYTDGAGRTLATTDAINNASYTGYNAVGSRTSYRDPNGLGEDCTLDALERETSCSDLQEQAEATARITTYNTASQPVTRTDAEGNTSSMIYDVRGRLESSTDANNITVSYFYDANNNLTALIDGNGNQRTWTYDARNLKIQKTNPGAGDVRTYTYDALRRLDIKTDQLGDTCQMVYDLASRMTSKEYKTGGTTLESTDTFVYDAASRLTSSTKGRYNVTVTHSYALDSMPTSESFTIDSRNYTISRAYDAGNRPTSHTFADGKSQLWSYDARNLVTNLSYDGQNVLTQTYDPGYRLTNQTLGNGLTRTLSYSRQDNLRTSDVTFDGITAIDSLNWSYTYNEDKQVTSENTAASFLDDTSFTATYDPGNRLISWNRTGLVTVGARETESWSYDNAGNHNSVTRNGTTTNRSHNTDNELIVLGGTATILDAKGNMTEDAEGNEYFYDLDNRINRIEMNGGVIIELAYDAFGRRVFRKNGSDETAYLWWGDQETSEHESSAGQPVIQNDLWAHPITLNKICARAVDGSKFDIEYYHKNYLDHVYAVSDDNGNIQEH